MNRTNWEHGLIALVIQAALAWWLGWACAGAVAVAIFAGREYAQVEYKVRSRTGMTLTQLQPWHVLRPSLWSLDAVLDIAVPAGLVLVVAWVVEVS